MVYYIYELRWASSDNTLKELDASGSFFIATCEISYDIRITEKNTILREASIKRYGKSHKRK